jgi:hypothetical protein
MCTNLQNTPSQLSQSPMALNKLDEFMDNFQHGHNANDAHDHLNITQELKSCFCN